MSDLAKLSRELVYWCEEAPTSGLVPDTHALYFLLQALQQQEVYGGFMFYRPRHSHVQAARFEGCGHLINSPNSAPPWVRLIIGITTGETRLILLDENSNGLPAKETNAKDGEVTQAGGGPSQVDLNFDVGGDRWRALISPTLLLL
jgi:hypothetical protein